MESTGARGLLVDTGSEVVATTNISGNTNFTGTTTFNKLMVTGLLASHSETSFKEGSISSLSVKAGENGSSLLSLGGKSVWVSLKSGIFTVSNGDTIKEKLIFDKVIKLNGIVYDDNEFTLPEPRFAYRVTVNIPYATEGVLQFSVNDTIRQMKVAGSARNEFYVTGGTKINSFVLLNDLEVTRDGTTNPTLTIEQVI